MAALDQAVRQRQNCLILGIADPGGSRPKGWKEVPGPFTVRSLVVLTNAAVPAVVDGAESVTISIGCALLSELVASALWPDEREAGGVYPKIGSGSGERFVKHGPLCRLRNALFHPGNLSLPNRSEPQRSMVDELIDTIEDAEISTELRRELRVSAEALQGFRAARWSLLKLHDMGMYELHQLLVSRLKRRKVPLSKEDEMRLLDNADATQLSRWLDEAERVSVLDSSFWKA